MADVVIRPIITDLSTTSAMVSLSESTLQELVRIGQFPAPRKMSGRRVGWLLREVEAWAESLPVSDLLPVPNSGARKPKANRSQEIPTDRIC